MFMYFCARPLRPSSLNNGAGTASLAAVRFAGRILVRTIARILGALTLPLYSASQKSTHIISPILVRGQIALMHQFVIMGVIVQTRTRGVFYSSSLN